MKKITINLFLLIVLLFITTILILSTIGIETNKFNNFISDKVSQKKNINLKLNTIKFKLNPKKLSLFLETENPEITFKNIFIPIKNIKLYIDFLSLSKKEPKIEKIILASKELDITQLKNLSVIIKPSNFKSLLNNKIKEGKVISEIEIFLTNQGKVKDFIARGTVKDLKAETFSDLNLKKLNLNFFADKYDILIKNIYGNLEDISILDGDVKLNLENGIKLKANFNSKLDLNEKFLNKYHKLFSKYKINNLKNLKADFNNIVSIDLDNTYKIKNYNYSISGIVEEGNIKLLNPITNKFITKKIESVYLSNFKILSNFQPKENKFKGDGKYSFNNLEFLNINLENNFNKDKVNLKLNFD